MAEFVDVFIIEHDGVPLVAIQDDHGEGAAVVGTHYLRDDGTSFVRIQHDAIEKL